MAKMKAAIVRNNPRRISMEEVDIPTPSKGEVLVKVKANGLCGSDVHGFIDENSAGRVEGLIMGHEATGTVETIGEGVEGWKKGDRVVVNPQFRCGKCYACQNGWFTVCEHSKIIGSALRGFVQGAMADFVIVPASHLHKLPDNLSFELGALVEPFANAIHVVNRVGINLGDNVVVMGAGTIGLCMVKMAKLSGAAKVIAIDVSDYNLNTATKFGADHLINSLTCDPVQAVRDICDGKGSDVTLEAAGLGKTYSQAALMTRKRGRFAFFGAAAPTATIDLYPFLHRELNMFGCTGFDVECDMAIDMMSKGTVDASLLISQTFPMCDSAKAIETFLDKDTNVIKIIITNED